MNGIGERILRAAVGFSKGKTTEDGRRTWAAAPCLPFKPLGLMIWGATALTRIHAIKVGNKSQHIISRETCPARLFAAPGGYMFEDFITLMKNKPTDGSFLEHYHYFDALINEFPKASQQQLVGLDTCGMGMYLSVEYVGPMTDLAMWGWTAEK